MSIAIDKWVKIASKDLQTAAPDRELILRIVTSAKKPNSETESAITPGTVRECTSAAEVAEIFGEGSPEFAVAKKYFSFVSLSATMPEKISFFCPGYFAATEKMTAKGTEMNFDTKEVYAKGSEIPAGTKIADSYSKAIAQMIRLNDNFATLMVIGGYQFATDGGKVTAAYTLSEPQILDRDTATKGADGEVDDYEWDWSANAISDLLAVYNNMFRYVCHVDRSFLAKQVGSITWEPIVAGESVTKSNLNDAATYLSRIAKSGVMAVLDDKFTNDAEATTYPGWLSCALLASTKYANQNSTIIQEFKALDNANMNVTCEDDSLYNILTEFNVNFYGRTQKAGKSIAFFLEGYNLDGTDTAVYDNEIWLKDRITTEIFNRFTASNKVPAGSIGVSIIKLAIENVISEALTNLTVTPEKTLEDSVRAAIIQNTGSTDAPNQIYLNGYYLDVKEGKVETVGKAKRRTVDYILYYSSGEGIRKVTGSDVLV